jgi:hypothetical protein
MTNTTLQSCPSNAAQFKDQTYFVCVCVCVCVCVKNAGSAHQSDKATLLTELHQPTYNTATHKVLHYNLYTVRHLQSDMCGKIKKWEQQLTLTL